MDPHIYQEDECKDNEDVDVFQRNSVIEENMDVDTVLARLIARALNLKANIEPKNVFLNHASL